MSVMQHGVTGPSAEERPLPAAPDAPAPPVAGSPRLLPMSRRTLGVAVGIAVVAVLGLALRLWTSSPLWLDEAQSVGIASLPVPQLLDALRTDGAPPVYYLLLHGWISLFGTGDLAVRSLSTVVSLISLALLWVVARRLTGSRRVALVAVLVGATNPWMVRYGSEARMYALVVVLVLAGTWALERVLRRGRTRDVAALALATGALLLTQYWAMFLLAAVGMGLCLVAWRAPQFRPRALRALAGVGLGGVLFLPWVPSFVYQVTHTGAPWADLPAFGRLAMLPLDWSGGEVPGGRWLLLVVLPLLVLGSVGVTYAGRTSRARVAGQPLGRVLAAVTVATLAVAVVVTRLTGSGIEPRYSAVVVPFVVLLLALGALALPRRAATAAVVALVALGLLASWDVARTPRTQAADLAEGLETYAVAGDRVVYCPDQLAPSISRLLEPGLAAGLTSLPVPSGSRLDRVDWVDYEKRLEDTAPSQVAADAVAGGGHAVWTLTSPRYRTHLGPCAAVRGELANRGLRPRTVVGMDTRAYEYALLERWAPPAPWDSAISRFDQLGAPVDIDR